MGNEASQGQGVEYGYRVDNDIVVSWKKVGNPFLAREGQICCVCGGKVYVFGGVSQEGQEVRESNDLLLFDPEKQTWSKIDVKGTPPPPRSAAALSAVGNKLCLFGGLSNVFGWFDDFYIFDTDTNNWSVPQCDGQKPSPRDKLQSAAIGKNIYYFGGFGPKSADAELEMEEDDNEDEDEETEDQDGANFGWFNDLYVFDTENKKWTQPMQMNLGVPTPRAAHAMCAFDRNLFIFGGRDIDSRRNDLHIYNVDSKKWDTDLQCKGRQPEPRSFHTATTVGHRVVVMGGRSLKNDHFADIHIYDTVTKEWMQPSVTGDLPSPRGQHSAAVAGDYLVLFGGSGSFNNEIMQCLEHFTDTYILKTADILKGGSKPEQNGITSKENGHST